MTRHSPRALQAREVPCGAARSYAFRFLCEPLALKGPWLIGACAGHTLIGEGGGFGPDHEHVKVVAATLGLLGSLSTPPFPLLRDAKRALIFLGH